MRPITLVADAPDEGWVSMNYCAEQQFAHLQALGHAVSFLQPKLPQHFRRIFGSRAWNADRIWHRQVRYPNQLRRWVAQHDTPERRYLVVDHSYASVIDALPHDRTAVYCHDLDAFRALLAPSSGARAAAHRLVAGRLLRGMRAARWVFYSTQDVGNALRAHQIAPAAQLVQAPLGVASEYWSAQPAATLPSALIGAPYVLHVGTTVARKRVDVLLASFAELWRAQPELRLVKAGQALDAEHWAQLQRLGVPRAAVACVGFLSRSELAALYQHAALVLIPSAAEGFGIPLIEAFACGAPVLCSDLPVFRETAGALANYAPVGDVAGFVRQAQKVLTRGRAPDESTRRRCASAYSWPQHAETLSAVLNT